MRITVVWATLQLQDVVTIALPTGSTVADAVACSGLLAHYRLDPAHIVYAIYGRRADAHAPLADQDRVELTRPLAADPKEMRQRRARLTPTGTPPCPAKRRRAR